MMLSSIPVGYIWNKGCSMIPESSTPTLLHKNTMDKMPNFIYLESDRKEGHDNVWYGEKTINPCTTYVNAHHILNMMSSVSSSDGQDDLVRFVANILNIDEY